MSNNDILTIFIKKEKPNKMGFKINNVDMFRNIMKQENIIIQAPDMTCRIQAFVGKDDLVVFMKRKWSDILRKFIFKLLL